MGRFVCIVSNNDKGVDRSDLIRRSRRTPRDGFKEERRCKVDIYVGTKEEWACCRVWRFTHRDRERRAHRAYHKLQRSFYYLRYAGLAVTSAVFNPNLARNSDRLGWASN